MMSSSAAGTEGAAHTHPPRSGGGTQLSQVRVVTAADTATTSDGGDGKFDGITKPSSSLKPPGTATTSSAESSSATLVWSGIAVSVADSQGRRSQILKGALSSSEQESLMRSFSLC